MLLEQKVIIKWNPMNREHYENLGYKHTKQYKEFEVNVHDLIPGTAKHVKIKCDYCSKIIEKSYRDYYKNKGKEHINKDACIQCRSKKIDEVKQTKTYMAGKSLGEHFPELIQEWSPKNDKTPFEYAYGTDKKVWWTCKKCNNEWKSSIENRTGNRKMQCPMCKNGISLGETKIKNFLELYKIEYKAQYIFEDLLSENCNPLRIDFAIFKNNKLKVLIEYDGEQHYKSNFYGEDNLKITQHRDNLKNNYCLENNIPLWRIPYWELDNIDDLLHYILPDFLN